MTLERLVLEQVKPLLDPLQLPIIYHHLHHLPVQRCLRPRGRAGECHVFWHLLGEKLTAMQVDSPLVTWLGDYLTGRPQHNTVYQSGQQLWTVPSPFIFTLYTTDLNYCSETCHLLKLSDDSAIVGCISEDEYRTTGQLCHMV